VQQVDSQSNTSYVLSVWPTLAFESMDVTIDGGNRTHAVDQPLDLSATLIGCASAGDSYTKADDYHSAVTAPQCSALVNVTYTWKCDAVPQGAHDGCASVDAENRRTTRPVLTLPIGVLLPSMDYVFVLLVKHKAAEFRHAVHVVATRASSPSVTLSRVHASGDAHLLAVRAAVTQVPNVANSRSAHSSYHCCATWIIVPSQRLRTTCTQSLLSHCNAIHELSVSELPAGTTAIRLEASTPDGVGWAQAALHVAAAPFGGRCDAFELRMAASASLRHIRLECRRWFAPSSESADASSVLRYSFFRRTDGQWLRLTSEQPHAAAHIFAWEVHANLNIILRACIRHDLFHAGLLTSASTCVDFNATISSLQTTAAIPTSDVSLLESSSAMLLKVVVAIDSLTESGWAFPLGLAAATVSLLPADCRLTLFNSDDAMIVTRVIVHIATALSMLHERMIASLRLINAAEILVLVGLVSPVLPCLAAAAIYSARLRLDFSTKPSEIFEPAWNISDATRLVQTLIQDPFVLRSEKLKLQPAHELELLAELLCIRNTILHATSGTIDASAQLEWGSMLMPFETIVQRMLELQVVAYCLRNLNNVVFEGASRLP
jgi:hypothetical protein